MKRLWMKLTVCGSLSLMMDKSFARRLPLNSAIVKSPYWVSPVDNKGHENFMPVGRGVVSSPLCGRHAGFHVCKNIEAHEGVSVNGVDYTGKVAVRHRHYFCKKSSCPKCFIRGWSVRGAGSIESRLFEGVKRGLGKIEHIVVSVAIADRDLSEYAMRKKCRDALFDRGVAGGCMIFHGYRIDKKREVLVWSPHYHVLGFILGGFDRCRDCVHVREDCASCDSFKGKEVRGYAKDGYLVKVMAEREKSHYGDKPNIFGTAFYQLNHATIKVSAFTRFHVVTWFGVCGNRKYKSEKAVVEVTCPACGDEMVRSVYVGKRHIVKDIGHPDYVSVFPFDEFDENGEPNFIDRR
jgi:hypothetical protein